jgi:U3 small nucleolar RNA-associated protein 14
MTADEYDDDFHKRAAEDDFSDEELDSDDAFDSEDERKYGSLFSNKGKKSKKDVPAVEAASDVSDASGDDEDDDASASDSEASFSASDSDPNGSGTDTDDMFGDDSDAEDGDNGEYMMSLLDNLDKPATAPTANGTNNNKSVAVNHAKLRESEFKGSSGAADNALTIESLLDPLAGGANPSLAAKYVDLRKAAAALGKHDTVASRASDLVLDRAQRKVAAKATDADVSLWTKSVKANREAETLDFRDKNRIVKSANSLVNKFEAETDFEKSIAEALDAAGDEKELAEKEKEEGFGFDSGDEGDDDLGHSKLTMEEFKKRQGQLAQMRSLLFYEERKRHQINKIKSKKFRKIHKKQEAREKEKEMAALRESNPELAKEMEEKEAIKRMEERMTLQHKNTSKWARAQLRRGKNMDKDARKALTEQVLMGDRLRRKQMGDEDGSGGSSDDGDDNVGRLKKDAEKALKNIEEDPEKEEREKRGLFKMAFMQKGLETQRQKAKTEAEELLRELREEEGGSDNDYDSGGDDDEEEDETDKRAKAPRGGAKEHVQGGVDINFDDDDELTWNSPSAAATAAASTATTVSGRKEKRKELEHDTANPWLDNAASKSGSKKKQKGGDGASSSAVIDINLGIQTINGGNATAAVTTNNNSNAGGGGKAESNAAPEEGLEHMAQDKLVKMAFAAPEDTEEEFRREKQALIDRDDPNKKKDDDKLCKGWGSWAGAGTKQRKKTKKVAKKLRAPERKVEPKKRADDDKPTVIINEKRVKKLSKFKLAEVPYPFTSAEQYERSMAGAVGSDWNTTKGFKDLTRPEIITRAGKIIAPASKRAKEKAKERKARF